MENERNIMRIRNVSKSFGGLTVLDDCSFDVKEGAITAIIGPNGAGKSTLLNIISGLATADCGNVLFRGIELSMLPPHKVAGLGIGRTFQQTRLFKNLTIRDNLLIAAAGMSDDEILKQLHQLKVHRPLSTVVSDLSYGQQRLVELARILALPHSMLLLDEPTAGVNQSVRDEIKQILLRLKREGKTIAFIEHDMDFVMGVSDNIIVLAEGKVLAQGSPSEIRKNPKVLEAYLGK